MATMAQENGANRVTSAAAQPEPPPPPHPENGGTPAAAAATTAATTTTPTAATATSPWREYLDRVAAVCDAEATGPPTADLLRPPTDLLAHPQRQQQLQQRGAVCTTTTTNGGSDSGIGNGSGEPEVPVDGGVATTTTAAGAAAAADLDPPPKGNQVLVLLDMNGTLLYRAKKPLGPAAVAASSGGGSKSETAAAAAVTAAAAFVHGDPDPFQYYMRPGAAELVAAMHRHPRVRLAFYTSMRGVNALPAARFLMPDDDDGDGTDGATPTPEVYDRPFNARDPHGANSWDTTRDLPLIWSTPGRAGAGFGPANTVMVDDTPRKMRFMDAGLVVVPEFTGACVLESLGLGVEANGDGDGDGEEAKGAEEVAAAAAAAVRGQREVLPRLLEYLGHLLEESGADVRPFIESNPFHPRDPFSSSSSSCSTRGKTENGCCVSPTTTAAARLSIVQAVELVLTTGPLSRERRDNGGGDASPAAAATVVASSGKGVPGRAATRAAEGVCIGGGRSSAFEGFGQSVQASVVDAVCGLLRGATAAAERWGLPPQERGRLEAWSRAAEATAAAAAGGGKATAGVF